MEINPTKRRVDPPDQGMGDPRGNLRLMIMPTRRTDGKTIYMTPLTFLISPPPHALHIKNLLYADLNDDALPRSIFLTTFCFDEGFIQPILQLKSPMKCLVTHEPTQYTKVTKVMQNLIVINPATKSSWGKFHSKVFLFKFSRFLRVVVLSANLMT